MKFAPQIKAAGSPDRTRPIEETLALVPALRESYGITRVSEITHLDRIGIPAISVVVPHSADDLSTYTGKGTTREEALVSGVFEAVERQAGAECDVVSEFSALHELASGLDLEAMGAYAPQHDVKIECVRGEDLLSGKTVRLPKAAIQCPWRGEPLFATSHTNGLAAGRTVLEAVYHGLMEIIERHSWSTTHLQAHVWPHMLRAMAGKQGDALPDDSIAFEMPIASAHPIVRVMGEQIDAAGFALRLLRLPGEHLPYTMCACISGQGETPALGFGTSWSATHASLRAITEAAQSRLTEIQGAREDMRENASGLPHGAWYFDGPAHHGDWHDLADLSCPDLHEDLLRTLAELGTIGVPNVYVTELGVRCPEVHAVRVLAPTLETFMVDGRINPRGRFAFMSKGAPLPNLGSLGGIG